MTAVCNDCVHRHREHCHLYPQLPLPIEQGKWPRFDDSCIFKRRVEALTPPARDPRRC